MQVDRELSKRLAEGVAKIHFRKQAADTPSETKQCWYNAYTAAMYLAHLVGDAVYVEGWAVRLKDGEVFEHGWLEREDEILDPTLWDEDLGYFAGLRFTLDEVERVKIETAGTSESELPLAWRIGGWSGSDDPAYREAYEAALAHAENSQRSTDDN